MYYNFSAKKPRRRPKLKEKPLDKKGKVIVCIGLTMLFVSALSAFGITALVQYLYPAPAPELESEESVTPIADKLDDTFLNLEPSDQNLVYSPLAIKNGLALLKLGAAGDTRAELTDLLGESLMLNTQNIADKISLANAIFIRDTHKDNVLASYTTAVDEAGNAEIIYDDFESANHIDAWVSNQTFGLINTLGIQPNADTNLVLVNALAVQLDWLHPFDTANTRERPFMTVNEETHDAATMSLTTDADDIYYFQDDNLSIVSLPLQPAGEVNLDFIAIMPRTTSLSQYLTNLDFKQLIERFSFLVPASSIDGGIQLYIPKFSFDYQLDFKKDLESLGITAAFAPKANFSNMATEPLCISDAVHKANIDFSEEGVKAATATVSIMKDHIIPDDILTSATLQFNHPFLFLIHDRENSTIWFTGTVYHPNLWPDDAKDYQM